MSRVIVVCTDGVFLELNVRYGMNELGMFGVVGCVCGAHARETIAAKCC